MDSTRAGVYDNCVMLFSAAALVFSGAAQALVSPPLNWVWLHPLSWVPALWVFSRLRGWRALLAGWVVGASAHLALYYWLAGTVTRYGGLSNAAGLAVLVLHALAMGVSTAIFAWGFGWVRDASGARWPFAVAAWFCALEFASPQVFPYQQGAFWYQVPQIVLLSALTGVAGVSFLVMLCNAVVLQGLEIVRGAGAAKQRAWAVHAALAVGLVLFAVAYSTCRLAAIEQAELNAPSVRIAIVQPNHSIERRRDLRTMGEDAFAKDMVSQSRVALQQTGAGGPIDVFVWPEGALRDDPSAQSNRVALEFVRETGAEVWTGATHHGVGPAGEAVSHNSAFRIFGVGTIDRRYDKNLLLPFGEYVPLRDVIPGFDRIPAVANFEAGKGSPVYAAGAARFVFLICYEAIRSAFVRRVIADDVNLLVNVTVDAWYGDSSEQSQHLMLAAMQSAMNGIPLVRPTTTGISAIVDARGVITVQTGVFTRETLIRDIRLLHVPGLYSRWGDWFAWLCVAVSLLVFGSLLRTRNGRGTRAVGSIA